MKQKRRVYTAEFRQEALRLLERSGKSVSEVEHELGMPAATYRSRQGCCTSGKLGIGRLKRAKTAQAVQAFKPWKRQSGD
jgi:transposase-like protein